MKGIHNVGRLHPVEAFLARARDILNEDSGFTRKAELSCARSHFCAIRVAASTARSTKERDGDIKGICTSKSVAIDVRLAHAQ